MNNELIKQLEYQLAMLCVGKSISDQGAYELHQAAKIVFDWFSDQCKPKLRRYLLYLEGIRPFEKYDPKKYYNDIDDELPF